MSRRVQRGMQIHLKSAEELAIMREAGRIVAQAHAAMHEAIKPGVSTWELDQIAEAVFRDHGAIPAFKDYAPGSDVPPFPATITASVNNELVHGIPSKDRILKEGDIISLDTGCHYEGFVGDSAWTWPVGEVPVTVQRLLEVGERALFVAIEAAVLPNQISDVAWATQNYVEGQGYSVAREYTGHGVGREMHEDPAVPNWWPRKRSRRVEAANVDLQKGMTIAIEPMVIAGRSELKELNDRWTVVTRDRSLCVHFEHTVAVTEAAPMILTTL